MSTMHALRVVVLLECWRVAWGQPCVPTLTEYVCKDIPPEYPSGLTSLFIFMHNLGKISVSMFNSTSLNSVISLTMTQNGITEVTPQTFMHFQNLTSLNLDRNALTQVSSGWFVHHALEVLTLSRNQITALDGGSFSGLRNLLTLDLSQNQIQNIHFSTFHSLKSLRYLNLSNNQLTYLSVDVLSPLNGTKIRLYENPWDCSCSVKDFVWFLKGLVNSSLLKKPDQLICQTPLELKNRPVLQTPECEIRTTLPPTTRNFTSSPSTSVQTSTAPAQSKPRALPNSTLLALIVLLCVLVLVIAVLSVLYHRKHQRRRLLAVKPVQDHPDAARTSVWSHRLTTTTAEDLLRKQPPALAEQPMSQIYSIYSSGICEYGNTMKRVQSAGPILCKSGRSPENALSCEEDESMRIVEYYDGWMTSETRNEAMDAEKIVGNQKDGEELRIEADTTLRPCEEMLTENRDIGQSTISDAEGLKIPTAGQSDCGSQEPSVQSTKDSENLQYLTIGTNTENQSPVSQRTTVWSRPLQRVLTWPPTVTQWKKHCAPNQQVLNVFPNFIFVTGCRHESGTIRSSNAPLRFPPSSQMATLLCLQDNVLSREDLGIRVDEANHRPYLQPSTHFIPRESWNKSHMSDAKPPDTWTSALESNVLSDESSTNSPMDESEVASELFSIFHPSSFANKSKISFGAAKMKKEDKLKKTLKRKHTKSELKRCRSTEEQKGPVSHSGASRARSSEPSGDDGLLVSSKDLLHEVVENHGRWTRERWKQTQQHKRTFRGGPP